MSDSIAEAAADPSIKSLTHAVVDRVIASGLIEQTLETAITKTITTALVDMTGAYSEFGKALKTQLAQSLACGPNLDLPTYGHLVLQIVRRQVDAAMGQQLQAQIEGTLAELLEAPPASIKLTELVAQFIEYHHELETMRDQSRSISLHVTNRDSGYRYICLDPERRKGEWDCEVRISVDPEGRVFGLSIDKADVSKRLFVGPLYGFERLLFRLYVNKTPIEFDAAVDDIDTDYPDSGD